MHPEKSWASEFLKQESKELASASYTSKNRRQECRQNWPPENIKDLEVFMLRRSMARWLLSALHSFLPSWGLIAAMCLLMWFFLAKGKSEFSPCLSWHSCVPVVCPYTSVMMSVLTFILGKGRSKVDRGILWLILWSCGCVKANRWGDVCHLKCFATDAKPCSAGHGKPHGESVQVGGKDWEGTKGNAFDCGLCGKEQTRQGK